MIVGRQIWNLDSIEIVCGSLHVLQSARIRIMDSGLLGLRQIDAEPKLDSRAVSGTVQIKPIKQLR